MATTRKVQSGVLGVDIERADASAEFPLGTCVKGDLDSEFVYVLADDAIAVGAACLIQNDWGAEEITTTNADIGQPVGFGIVALAAGEYGWLQRNGYCDGITVAASAAANVVLNTTATAGTLDDDGTASSHDIDGVVLQVADGGSGGNVAGFLNYPVVGAAN